ncbi:sulfite exporter TauE/SafE family protein [Thermus tengchongensis]|uniref:sulfite exporter TauE/SafE family protein n=1 Tax=Thermus tengchongensis TaxID=1214928 RepID=UPI001F34B14F|nr:sulfite exporter TauE/SafE family protein [Thermus tengchongensis]
MGFLIGVLGGAFGGLVGLGGGVVMVPLMVGLLKLSQHKAHGTSLVAVFFTGLMGAVTYGLQGSLNPKAALLLAATAILTARLGARYAHGLPEEALRRAFGLFLLFVSLLLLLRPHLAPVGLVQGQVLQDLALLLAGSFTGFLSGMMGVGGGTIMVPAMVLLLGVDQHTAQGTSLLAMVPASLVGAYAHHRLGNVEAPVVPGLVPGVLAGTFLGGEAAHLLSENALRWAFAGVLLWTGWRYLHPPGRRGRP